MKKAIGLLLASLVNKERLLLNLNKVEYDIQLHNFLKFNVTDNGSYFYDTSPYYKSWTIEGNTRHCDLNGCFMTPMDNNYMFRDTMKDSIVKIFKYRIAQKGCDHTDFYDGAKCSWYYHYFPVMMSNYTSFACKVLDYQGKFVPESHKNRQFKSFWCYFDGILPWFK